MKIDFFFWFVIRLRRVDRERTYFLGWIFHFANVNEQHFPPSQPAEWKKHEFCIFLLLFLYLWIHSLWIISDFTHNSYLPIAICGVCAWAILNYVFIHKYAISQWMQIESTRERDTSICSFVLYWFGNIKENRFVCSISTWVDWWEPHFAFTNNVFCVLHTKAGAAR